MGQIDHVLLQATAFSVGARRTTIDLNLDLRPNGRIIEVVDAELEIVLETQGPCDP